MWLRLTSPALLVRLSLLLSLLLLLTNTADPQTDWAGAQTNPRFVDKNGMPLAGTTVRVLCYATASAGSPVADRQMTTDASGYPVQLLPGNCNYVAALQRLHEQPSGKPGHGPAYTVYATSWSPGSSTPQPASGDVSIRDDRPLVLFNVVASLEWEPAPGSGFAGEVRAGLLNASAYLYDLAEGQMAFGPAAIFTGGRVWEGADLRVLAANDYRPTALVGGMVAVSRPYTMPVTGAETVYVPGEILLGRRWNGLEAFTGAWSAPAGFRTLVHEWGHYALFLYDEYQQSTGAETYCTCLNLPSGGCDASAMSYHYTAGELWLSGAPSVCLDTDQWMIHGEQDWQTLQLRWASIQGLSGPWLQLPVSLDSGPALSLAGDLFGRLPGFQIYMPIISRGGALTSVASEPTVTLKTSTALTSTLVLNALYPQVYVAEGGTAAAPTRLVYQGTTTGPRAALDSLGQITLLDVHADDRARVFLDRYAMDGVAGGRFVHPAPGATESALVENQILTLSPSAWTPSLDIAYAMTGPLVTPMTVTLKSPQSLSSSPIIQLCTPASDVGCPTGAAWRKTMTPGEPNTWQAAFAAAPGAELPHRGLLRVEASGVGEMIRWFQMAGGVGPAHMFGEAPMLDGMVMADTVGAAPGENNQLVFMHAASYAALTSTLPSTIEGLLGSPWEVDIVLPGGASGPDDHALPVPVRLTLFYSQAAVDRLGIAESDLRVLHFSRAAGAWFEMPVAGGSTLLNWLATGPIHEDGIYAVGWAAPPPVTPTAPEH